MMHKYAHGGEIYNKQIELDFSVNINPLGLPEKVKDVLRKQVDAFSRYPDDNCSELVQSLAEFEQVDPGYILCGNGASDLIFRIIHSLKPKRVIITAPAFSEYEKALESSGCEIEFYKLKKEFGFELQKDILDHLEDGLDMLFLCNPNNPTGKRIPAELAGLILESCREKGIFLVMDECFIEFMENGEQASLKHYANSFENLVVLKALTKLFSMAGLRLGYVISGNRKLLQTMAGCGQTWAVSVPAQLAGIEALRQREYLEETKKIISRERNYLYQAFLSLGWKVYEPHGNFLFFEGPEGLYEKLLDKGILIRSCENYRGLQDGNYYRVAVMRHEANTKLIKVIHEVCFA